MANKSISAGAGDPKKTLKAPVVVIWNQPKVWLLHGPVEVRGRSLTKVRRMNPGANEISADVWAGLQDRADVKRAIKKGDLRLIMTESGAPVERIPNSLEKLSDVEALALVENTMDEAKLQTWAKSEKRKVIGEAIKTQLAKLEAAVPDNE